MIYGILRDMSYGLRLLRRVALLGVLIGCGGVAAGMLIVTESQQASYNYAVASIDTTEAFPLGVDPRNATINEQIIINEFYDDFLAEHDFQANSWWSRVTAVLQTNNAFQLLASPVSRIIVIWPGERSEQATKNIGDVLRWDAAQRAEFSALMTDNELSFDQGFVPPGQYITHRYATPADIATQLQSSFAESVTDRYTADIERVVPLADTLIIASLIEREASDFTNMREISGVIWNRLFIDMKLQLDASLQYVKAENPNDEHWWPAVRPADKFLDSEFNTYQNAGLPPAPIANPSVEAIVATLNPMVTDCLYYFHSRTGEYYCSVTYPEHVAKLTEVYSLDQ